jgi:AcrR family transcriptional regulator
MGEEPLREREGILRAYEEHRRRVRTRHAGAARRGGRVMARGRSDSARNRAERRRQAQGAQVEQMQRSRLLAGAVRAIDEHGYAQVTVSQITRRAGVSRRTFYEIFANREECLTAVIEDVVSTIVAELAELDLEGQTWRERIRAGLTAILAFLDREPVLARVCVVQALQAGPRVLERREAILAGLAAAFDEGRLESARGEGCTPLTAEGLIGAAFGIAYARLQRGEEQPLTALLNELMAMIVLPYLGPAAARREQTRPLPEAPREEAPEDAPVGDGNPMSGLGMRFTYRTALVLEGVQLHPGASNREVAQYAEVHDPAQISRLLGRLERAGLLVNTGGGHARGEPNAWSLTPRGEQVARSISSQAGYARRAA